MTTFSGLIRNLSLKPSDNLVQRIDSKKHPFSNYKLFQNLADELAYHEFKRCVELYEKRLANEYGYNDIFNPLLKRYNKVRGLISEREAPYKKELEELSRKTIKGFYNVPSHIEIEGEINPHLNFNDLKRDESTTEEEDDDEDEIFDEETLKEFEQYLEENGEEETPFVSSYAINLPVLLHETNKAVLDILNTYCIPHHLSAEELEKLYERSDKYKDEIWHYFFGPSLWNNLLSVMNDLEYGVEDVFQIFSYLSKGELTFLMYDVVRNKDDAISSFKSYMDDIERGTREIAEGTLEDEVEKRTILNSIVHGSSVHAWKSSYFMLKDEIEKINSDLIPLYNEYSSIVSIMLWMFDPSQMEKLIEDQSAITQGYSKIDW